MVPCIVTFNGNLQRYKQNMGCELPLYVKLFLSNKNSIVKATIVDYFITTTLGQHPVTVEAA
jgi:hypothetical protein